MYVDRLWITYPHFLPLTLFLSSSTFSYSFSSILSTNNVDNLSTFLRAVDNLKKLSTGRWITYPQNCHRPYSKAELSPIYPQLIHRFFSVIHKKNLSVFIVDNLSTGLTLACRGALRDRLWNNFYAHRKVIHLSTSPTTTAFLYIFIINKNNSR